MDKDSRYIAQVNEDSDNGDNNGSSSGGHDVNVDVAAGGWLGWMMSLGFTVGESIVRFVFGHEEEEVDVQGGAAAATGGTAAGGVPMASAAEANISGATTTTTQTGAVAGRQISAERDRGEAAPRIAAAAAGGGGYGDVRQAEKAAVRGWGVPLPAGMTLPSASSFIPVTTLFNRATRRQVNEVEDEGAKSGLAIDATEAGGGGGGGGSSSSGGSDGGQRTCSDTAKLSHDEVGSDVVVIDKQPTGTPEIMVMTITQAQDHCDDDDADDVTAASRKTSSVSLPPPPPLISPSTVSPVMSQPPVPPSMSPLPPAATSPMQLSTSSSPSSSRTSLLPREQQVPTQWIVGLMRHSVRLDEALDEAKKRHIKQLNKKEAGGGGGGTYSRGAAPPPPAEAGAGGVARKVDDDNEDRGGGGGGGGGGNDDDEEGQEWRELLETYPWSDRLTRPYDTPICNYDLPAEQAKAMMFSGHSFDFVVTSPFRRCLQTAGAVCEQMGITEVIVHMGLGERMDKVKQENKGGADFCYLSNGDVTEMERELNRAASLKVAVNLSLMQTKGGGSNRRNGQSTTTGSSSSSDDGGGGGDIRVKCVIGKRPNEKESGVQGKQRYIDLLTSLRNHDYTGEWAIADSEVEVEVEVSNHDDDVTAAATVTPNDASKSPIAITNSTGVIDPNDHKCNGSTPPHHHDHDHDDDDNHHHEESQLQQKVQKIRRVLMVCHGDMLDAAADGFAGQVVFEALYCAWMVLDMEAATFIDSYGVQSMPMFYD